MPEYPKVRDDYTALDAAGEATPSVFSIQVTYQYTIASIGTSLDVVIEGSLDNTNWVELSSVTNQTSNGTYQLSLSPVGRVPQHMRLKLKTVTGGSPTVSVKSMIAVR